MYLGNKILIVEGSSDKKKIASLISEPVKIICTNGTISHDKLEQFIEHLVDEEVIILVDSDRAGEKLRKQLKRAFPLAKHLYVDKKYREVAAAPDYHLASILLNGHIAVRHEFLNGK